MLSSEHISGTQRSERRVTAFYLSRRESWLLSVVLLLAAVLCALVLSDAGATIPNTRHADEHGVLEESSRHSSPHIAEALVSQGRRLTETQETPEANPRAASQTVNSVKQRVQADDTPSSGSSGISAHAQHSGTGTGTQSSGSTGGDKKEPNLAEEGLRKIREKAALVYKELHPPPPDPKVLEAQKKAYDALREDVLSGGAPSKRVRGPGPDNKPGIYLRAVMEEDDIPTSKFLMRYGTQYGQQPVKVTGSQTDWLDPEEWTMDAIRGLIGDNSLFNKRKACRPGAKYRDHQKCHYVREADPSLIGKAWASLKSTNLTELGITTFSELFDKQMEFAKEGRYLYAHEVSGYVLPQLEKRMCQPKYFRNSFSLLETTNAPDAQKMMQEEHFPSFFFGPPGSSSPLHTDAHMTRFWLLQLAGKKLVRLIAPPDNWRGDVGRDAHDFAPSLFTIDLLNPDYEKHPNMAGLVVWEAVLEPGDILFIPEGWAHQALNLEWSAMISANYVDDNNLRSVINMDKFDTGNLTDVLRTEIGFGHYYLPLYDLRADLENVPLAKFFRDHAFEYAPVSRAAKDHIALLKYMDLEPDMWRDRFGRPVLMTAVQANYVSLAKWLVEEQKVPLDNDEVGRLFLEEVVEERGLRAMSEWMRSHMGLPPKDWSAAKNETSEGGTSR